MGLYTNNANVFIQTTSPESPVTGWIWVDTSLSPPVPKFYDGSAWQKIGKFSFSNAAVVTHSTTIGDYTSPTGATSSSESAVTDQETYTQTSQDATQNIPSGSITRRGAKIQTGHDLVGKVVDGAAFWLKKTGSPTGTASCTIRNSADTLQITLGTVDVSTLTGTLTETKFQNLTGHTITADDRILIEYTGGDGSNYIEVGNWQANLNANITYEWYDGSYTTEAAKEQTMRVYTQVTQADDNVYDDKSNPTTLKWSSDAEANPYIEVDLGSDLNVCAVALHKHTDDTETEYKIQAKPDGGTLSDLRKITASNITASSWTYWRNNVFVARYVRIYGNSGSSLVAAFNEIAILTKTDTEILADLGILEIDATDTTLGADGT